VVRILFGLYPKLLRIVKAHIAPPFFKSLKV
jgi:hypothetical protein